MSSRHHEELIEIGNRILDQARIELYMDIRFMSRALGSLDFVMDLSTRRVGTDGAYIRYNPAYLTQLYLREPEMLNRTYMHLVVHCLLRHMFKIRDKEDIELWDLCCDIATEYVVDSMDYRSIRRVTSDKRTAWYEKWEEELGTPTAEKLYNYFITRKRYYYEEESMRQEFSLDDHSFWERLNDRNDNPPGESVSNRMPEDDEAKNDRHEIPEGDRKDEKGTDPMTPLGSTDELEENWKENARQIESELEDRGSEAGSENGALGRMLSISTHRRRDYRDYLRKFSVVREEAYIDPDSFDYGFYNYGMEMYGNMPLIEENEFREANKVEELVIAIDTSASCQKKLVKRFVRETYDILTSQETFFHKFNLHIIECDNQIQKDIEIRGEDDIAQYLDGFEVRGGYGTDFRPVFEYVKELKERDQLTNLKGLLYFTDGFGEYPVHPTEYETAFVYFDRDNSGEKEAPDWALKLFLEEIS